MRFRGQPVAAGGKEIGLVEPIHRLKGLDTFCVPLHPRFSTTFPSSAAAATVGAEIGNRIRR